MSGTHFCDRCGAPIRWVTSKKGTSFPIEPSSDPRGTFMLTAGADGRQIAIGLSRAEQLIEREHGTLLFLHHQAVCRPRGRQGSAPPPAVRRGIKEIISTARSRHASK